LSKASAKVSPSCCLSVFDILKRDKSITAVGEAMHETEIEIRVRKLPENLKRRILSYVEIFLEKYQGKKSRKRKLKFDWEGGLSDMKKEFTSVELQHEAEEWR
jgi:hypothetical protein